MILVALATVSSGSAQEPDFNRNLASSAAVSAPTTVTPAAGCSTTDCHPGIKDHTYLHGPLQVNACDACHSLADAEQHSFLDVRPRNEICLSCHDLSYSAKHQSIHKPVAEGACMGCHDPHGSEHPRATLGSDQSALCLSCHDALTHGNRIAHAPESKGACTTCHVPHSSSNDHLLIDSGRSLCLTCHVETAQQLASSFLKHEPAQEDCRLCHDPHASSGPSILISEPASLCLGCHVEIGDNLNAATHPHAAMTQDKACLNCHQPHASDHGKLLRGATADLCYQCHDEEVERAAGGSIPSISKIMQESNNAHSPAQRGECTLCHQVHGNDHLRLLKREYVPTYASFQGAGDYSLCFSCHDKNSVLDEETAAVTNFRNGTRNLHFVHVNSRKSRSCNICHNPHAANSAHILRSTFPFGPSRWPLAIDWKATPEGGSCAAGCHAPFEYNRTNPVTYPRPNIDDQSWRGHLPTDPSTEINEEIQ